MHEIISPMVKKMAAVTDRLKPAVMLSHEVM